MLSYGNNKSSVFNGLQAKLTGSNPVALTTFPDLDSGNKYNDLANNSLKTLSNLKHPYLMCTYLVLNSYLKIRSKIGFFGNFSLYRTWPKMLLKGINLFFIAQSFVFYIFFSRIAETAKTANFGIFFGCFVTVGYSSFFQKKTSSEIRMKSSFK